MDFKTGATLFLASLLVLVRPGCGYKRHLYNLQHISAGESQRNSSSDYDIVDLFSSLNFPSHLHLLVLYTEEYTEAVRSISEKLQSLSGGLTSLRHDGTHTTLEVFFRLASPSTVFVLLCSPEAVVDIFQTMKSEHLRFHLMSFLVILKRESDDVVGILEDLLHEGILVKILLEESAGNFGILLPHVNANGSVRFINQGNWSIRRIAPSKNLVEPNRLSRQYSVNGRHMTVAGKDAWPAFKLGRTLPDGTIEPESGVDAYILRALSSTLNFTYHVVPSPDNAWGGRQSDGTVTGIIGMVARREADFAVTFTGITANRESVTDFTFPYLQGKLRLFSRTPKEKNRALAILSPFSSMVWLCITASVLLIGPITYIYFKTASCYQEEVMVPDLQWYSFNMFRSIVVQGNYMKTQAWATRLLIFGWFLFCLVISALYSGNLTAVLAVPSFEKPIDSLNDLPRAVREGFTLGVMADTTNEYIFKTATGGIYKQTWNLFNHKDRSQSFVRSPQVGMIRVLEDKFVFILGDAFAEVMATKLGRRKFYFGRESFAYVNVGIACQTGALYRDIFSDVLLRLGEGGLIPRWLGNERSKGREVITSKDDSETKTIAITLTHLQAAFYQIVIGYLLASVVLLSESVFSFYM